MKKLDDGYRRRDRLVDLAKLMLWGSIDALVILWGGHSTHWGKSFWDAAFGS